MGYRSDVYLRFDESAVEVVNAVRQFDPVLDKMMKESTTGGSTDFHWSDVKWYDCSPDVLAVESLLEALSMDTITDCGEDFYGFIRIGEESTDVEHKGEPCTYNMYTYTQMEW